MARRTVYVTVRLDIDSPERDEITNGNVDKIIDEFSSEFISAIEYGSDNLDGYEIDATICGTSE
ncbi:MAG: hypothetical protein LBL58_13905 [Tannerellaceae bacterium]|jgi:hypothetical protein|nr:hypothetical protein [Tannerellaceae bacterium]